MIFFLIMISIGRCYAIQTKAKQAYMIDYDTGSILFNKNGEKLTEPASMTKMMTVHMLFQKIQNGTLSMHDTFHVSNFAWRKGGSKMFVEVNTNISLTDLLHGIIVQSGNDAAIVASEELSNSEKYFSQDMTQQALDLGMKKSVFKNATGWPALGHIVTVHDLALLAQDTICHFPKLYQLYSLKEFTYNNIRQINRNTLLGYTDGIDGLKTGHTQSAGYGLTSSAVRNGRRLILVLNGLSSLHNRFSESKKILDWGFSHYNNYRIFSQGESAGIVDVWLGSNTKINLLCNHNIFLTLPRYTYNKIKLSISYDNPIIAPIHKGQKIAVLKIESTDENTCEFPLYADNDIEKIGFFYRISTALKYIFRGVHE